MPPVTFQLGTKRAWRFSRASPSRQPSRCRPPLTHLWRTPGSGRWAAPAPWLPGSACLRSPRRRCWGRACGCAVPAWGSPSHLDPAPWRETGRAMPSFCFEVISLRHGRCWRSSSHTLIFGLQGKASLLSGQSVQNSFAECISFHCLTHFHVFFIWVWRMLYFFIFMYKMIYFYIYVKDCLIYLQQFPIAVAES